MNLLKSRNFQPIATSLICLVVLTGCGDPFGTPPPDVTTKPSAKQIQYCRDVMYINPKINITPVGYYYEHGFQDDSIAFKFVAQAERIDEIFLAEFVPPSELVERTSSHGLDYSIGEKWWDPSGQTLIGDNFSVPPPNSQGTRALNVGIIDNGEKSFTVYVYWFET